MLSEILCGLLSETLDLDQMILDFQTELGISILGSVLAT